RSIVIDTVGLLLQALVTAASVQDSIAGQTLVEHAATLGIDMHVRRNPATRGFTSYPAVGPSREPSAGS
ncbi:hypothetical protein ACFWAX_37635, partial [Streptomyces sp. NPDC059956]